MFFLPASGSGRKQREVAQADFRVRIDPINLTVLGSMVKELKASQEPKTITG
jgi:hypothetical protein